MSHETFSKRAVGADYKILLDMAHSGGRDYGSVSIWREGKHVTTKWVQSETEGLEVFRACCEEYNCKEGR